MATYRIGIGSFSLAENGGVGVGTDATGQGNLKVKGILQSTDLDIPGVSTFTRYGGFSAESGEFSHEKTLTGEYNTSGDIVVGLGNTLTLSGIGSTLTVGTVESVSIGTHFSPPTAGTEDRPEAPVEGTVRFNTDLNTLEFYNGVEWRQFTVYGSGGDRAIIGNGSFPAPSAGIYKLNISSKGNTEYFGEAVTGSSIRGWAGSSTRGILNGGFSPATPGYENTIEYVTLATSGNGVDFGDTSVAHFRNAAAASSSTRNLMFAGGHPSYYNTIEYIQIPTLGNGKDFGNLTNTGASRGSFSSPTRAFVTGGFPASQQHYDMVTIATLGNAVDFGKQQNKWYARGGAANNTRGIFAGGYNYPHQVVGARMEYITMASGGNSQYFGDLSQTRNYPAGTASQTRVIFAGGWYPGPAYANVIDYVDMASLGNAIDFGDLATKTDRLSATSVCHGGLGGY